RRRSRSSATVPLQQREGKDRPVVRGRRLKLGIVCDEFFHADIGGYGGFGWLAREVARLFNESDALATDVVFLAATPPATDRVRGRYHGVPVVFHGQSRVRTLATIFSERIDMLFVVDYRETYS